MKLQNVLANYGLEWTTEQKREGQTLEGRFEEALQIVMEQTRKTGDFQQAKQGIFSRLFWMSGRLSIANPERFAKRMGINQNDAKLLTEFQDSYGFTPIFHRLNDPQHSSQKRAPLLTFKKHPEELRPPSLIELIEHRMATDETSLDYAFSPETLFGHQFCSVFIPLEIQAKKTYEIEEKVEQVLTILEQSYPVKRMAQVIEKSLEKRFNETL